MNGFDEARDATRRTRLANERTYLAWWRTGLTAFAVSLGAGKLAPEIAGGAAWPFEVVGVGFALLGIACCGFAYARQPSVESALRRGDFAPLGEGTALALAAGGVLLGIATALLVAFG
jgi:putative membrane protein